MRNQNNLIAKEGWPFVIFFLLISGGLFLFGNLKSVDLFAEGVLFFLIALFTVYFFRNPTREISDGDGCVVAPADGTIIKVEECHEGELLDDDAVQISIFMSLFNVHINRVPVSGTVENIKYHPGRFIAANLDKASSDNERSSMLIRTGSDALVLVVQIAGLIARRIVSYPHIGDSIERGKRYGLIRFGSRLDVYMPRGSKIVAKTGQKIKAGEVLGYLK